MSEELGVPVTNGFIAIARQDYPEYGINENDVIDVCVHDESVICNHYRDELWVQLIRHTWIPVQDIDVPDPVDFSIPEE